MPTFFDIIAQAGNAVAEQAELDDTFAPSGGGDGFGGGLRPAEGSGFVSQFTVERPSSFASAARDQFDTVREQLRSAFGLREEADLTSRINRAASDFRAEFGRWPRVSELFDGANVSVWLAPYMGSLLNGTFALPPFFEFEGQTFYNDEFEGPRQLPPPRFLAGAQPPSGPVSAPSGPSVVGGGTFDRLRETPTAEDRAAAEGGVGIVLGPDRILTEDERTARDPVKEAGAGGSVAFRPRTFSTNVPTMTADQIQSILDSAVLRVFKTGGGGGGRRGGGGGRAARVFDQAEVLAGVEDLWRSLLLEDAPDADATRVAQAYMAEANAFWMGEGGDLDFETFVTGELQKRSKWKLLYSRKPGHLTPRQYIAERVNAVAGFGLPSGDQNDMVTRAAQLNLSPSGLNEQARQSRTVQRRGGFAERIAGAVANLGVLART